MFGASPFSSAPISGSSSTSYLQALTAVVTSVASIAKLPKKLFSVAVTSTKSIQRSIGKNISTVVENVLVVLTESAFHLISFTINITNNITIVKALTKTINATISNTVSIIKLLGKTLSVSVTKTVTLTLVNVVSKILSVTSSTTASIALFRQKIMSVVSTSTISISKALASILMVTVNSIISLIVAVFPRLGTVERYTFIINTRDRLQKLFKIRTELANKRQSKVAK
jgi:hypothetical protein